MSTSKRHYRVAERNKELENEECALTHSNLQQFTFLGLCIYIISLILSFSVGYLIGKNN